jgi:hypothetical protein
MAVHHEREAGAQHEQHAVHVPDRFLQRDGADGEDVAHDDDEELDERHRHRQPHHDAPETVVQCIDEADRPIHRPLKRRALLDTDAGAGRPSAAPPRPYAEKSVSARLLA